MDNNALDKIKKLLALSHSDNENEAARALAAAIRIARQHDIDLEKVKGTEFMEEIDSEDAFVKSRLEIWETTLFYELAKYFGCRMLSGHTYIPPKRYDEYGHLPESFTVYGTERDRKTVIYLATYLRRCLLQLWRKNKMAVLTNMLLMAPQATEYAIRRDYLRGATASVLRNAKEIFDRDPEAGESNPLIIKKGYAVDRYIADRIKPRSSGNRTAMAGIAAAFGAEDGKNIDIRRPLDEQPAPAVARIG